MEVKQYYRHLELFGPDQIVETAYSDSDVSDRDWQDLKFHTEYMKRAYEWSGKKWIEKVVIEEGDMRPKGPYIKLLSPKKCDFCGLDLPRSRNAKARFHGSACRQAYYRKQRKERLAREREQRIAEARANRRARKKAKNAS